MEIHNEHMTEEGDIFSFKKGDPVVYEDELAVVIKAPTRPSVRHISIMFLTSGLTKKVTEGVRPLSDADKQDILANWLMSKFGVTIKQWE